MRLNIRIKMFLVLLFSNVAIIASMYIFFFVSLESGFNEYVEELEEVQLHGLSLRLGNLYQAKNNFSFLKNDKGIVGALENLLLLEFGAFPEETNEALETADKSHLFFVLDSDKNAILGDWIEDNDQFISPIHVGEKIVGWVGFQDVDDMFDDEIFIEGQNQDFLIITAITLIFSALFAMAAAYHFEKPVKALAKGTKTLASGRYDIRLEEQSTDEIGDLTRDFNSLADKLEENERARKKWVEDISHELKTPLTLLSGEIEAVQDGVRPFTAATIELLGKDIDHLSTLVNDLNDLWRTETGTMSFSKKKILLIPIVQHCLENFRQQFTAKGLTLEFHTETEEDLKVEGDSSRLMQLYNNLLQNSLRYTNTGGVVRLLIRKDQNDAIINIHDSEPGVDPVDFDRIFDRLYRVEPSRNREFGGAGIGLTISRNIVLAHDGIIRAEASPLGGLGLQITLPLS